jgi:hypothetical protein
VLGVAAAPAPARADQCRVVEATFQPADLPSAPMRSLVQVVAWIEDPAGRYVDTVYITRDVGLYGLGNRPGRYDFNSGPKWPYGRRITTFPVWAHRYEAFRSATNRHPPFPEVVFQTEVPAIEDALSHSFQKSSRDLHYCRPLLRSESGWAMADAGTCASAAYTDKGMLSPTRTSLYPPRRDLVKTGPDHPSVEQFAQSNPFDAVSGASPLNGQDQVVSWSIPRGFPRGNYVMWIEVSREFDHNATYSEAAYPAPNVSYGEYGKPYRGQPSVLYTVPFAIGDTETIASTAAYAGYGDPAGQDGLVRPPDGTIQVDVVGSGAQRLALAGGYRVKVTARPEPDSVAPGALADLGVMDVTSSSAQLAFTSPGDDGLVGKVKGYEIRMRADGLDVTEENFADSFPVTTTIPPGSAGDLREVKIEGLLFETEYVVGIRAYDDCRNTGPIALLRFTTSPRNVGEVDACFVATAAYGSTLANDVEMLRRFRDSFLQRTVLGELAVETYYTFGPAMAGLIGESDLLRVTARTLLAPLVSRVKELKL